MVKYLSLVVCLCVGLVSRAQQFYNANASEYNTNEKGIFMQGYDLVSYFTGPPEIGKSSTSHTYKAVTYWFASEENKNLFIVNPEKYLPKYGGWCAIGVCFSVVDSNYPSGKYKVDPLNYEIYHDHLYFFYPENEFAAKKLWSQNKDSFISQADSIWRVMTQ